MPKPDRQVLVCLNTRPPGNPKGSCGEKDAQRLYDALRDRVKELGLDPVMVNRTSCLKHCSQGATISVQPDNVWYAKLTAEDVDELCQKQLIEGEPIERLIMPDIPWE